MSQESQDLVVQDEENNFLENQRHALVEAEKAEVVQRVQAQFVIAQRFPRHEEAAIGRIRRACQRKSLAEVAIYSVPRGGKSARGPSIRLAEVLAQNWGNLDYGIREIEQVDGRSVVEAYCSDLETNTHQRRVFTVFHKKKVGKGSQAVMKELTDPQEAYEHVANYGARRMRSCILAIIPRDVVEAAVSEVEKTLRIADGSSLTERVDKMVKAFGDIRVTVEMLEKRLGHAVSLTTDDERIELLGVYNAVSKGEAKRHEFFDMPAAGGKASLLADELAKEN